MSKGNGTRTFGVSFSSTKPSHCIPKNHMPNGYFTKAALKMPGSSEASVANASFNVTPIKSTYVCTPKRGTIHPEIKSSYDSWINNYVAPWRIIEPLTNLAMVEQWVLPVKLSFYDDELGHISNKYLEEQFPV